MSDRSDKFPSIEWELELGLIRKPGLGYLVQRKVSDRTDSSTT